MSNIYQAIIDLGSYDSELEPLVGRRALSRSYLLWHHFPAPNGFILTPVAFSKFLANNNGVAKWKLALDSANRLEPSTLVEVAKSLQKIIKFTPFDLNLADQITAKYHATIGTHKYAHLTISPSSLTLVPTTPLLPVIKGETSLLECLKELWAAQITPHFLSLVIEKQNIIPHMPPVIISEYEPDVS